MEYIILLIAVVEGVWILSSILRPSDEEQKVPRPRSLPRTLPGQQALPAREEGTGDHFLDIINQRRREAAGRQAASRTGEDNPAARRRAAERPDLSRRRAIQAVSANKVVSPIPQPFLAPGSLAERLAEKELPVAEVIREEVKILKRAKRSGRRDQPPPVNASSFGTSPLPILGTSIDRQPGSPILRQLLPLIRSSQAVAAATVLNEIFGKPRCQRPFQRRI